jgi:hypothetical protein
MSLQSISQTDIRIDSLVCITPIIARQIVIDLEYRDLLVIENDTLKANIEDYNKIIKLHEVAFNMQKNQIDNLTEETSTLIQKQSLLELEIEQKEQQIEDLKTQRNIIGGTSGGLILLLLIFL